MMSSTSSESNENSATQQIQTVKSPKNAHKPLKKHMTYNLSETTNAAGGLGSEKGGGVGDVSGGAQSQHHHFLLNRTNSLLVAEELLNEINHANLAHNHNMSYNDNMNISNIDSAVEQHRFINEHAVNFINSHMRGHIGSDANGESNESGGGGGGGSAGARGHLHRTKEVENLVDLSGDESCGELDGSKIGSDGGDDLIKTGLEMIHGVTHLTRTHEIENLNEASKDD